MSIPVCGLEAAMDVAVGICLTYILLAQMLGPRTVMLPRSVKCFMVARSDADSSLDVISSDAPYQKVMSNSIKCSPFFVVFDSPYRIQ